MLDIEVELTVGLHSKVVTILRKQEFPSSGFLVAHYVSSQPNDIILPRTSIPWRHMYIRYPSDELLQTYYVSG
jgi:hypothetical protein